MNDTFIINHLGEERCSYYGAVAPPIFQTSNFCFPDVETMRSNISDEFSVPFYTRGNNPTVSMLRKKLAALEQAEDSLITSSGCAAITSAVTANIMNGEHAVCVRNCYSWAYTLFNDILKKFGVSTTFTDSNAESVINAIKTNTKLIYLESPTSFFFEMQDLQKITSVAKNKGIITIIDNSYSTPLYQKPITCGVDIVLHSASKYIGGHSDVIAGVICSNCTMIKKIFNSEYLTFGGIATPQTAWLLLRGLRTLQLRLQKSAENAMKLAEFLEQHSSIERVLHPGLLSHPQHSVSRKQMSGYSGLFSFHLKTTNISEIDKFCNSLQYFLLACSWGGHESLVFPAAVLYSSNNNNKKDIPVNLIRLYTGLENCDLLLEDVDNALKRIH